MLYRTYEGKKEEEEEQASLNEDKDLFFVSAQKRERKIGLARLVRMMMTTISLAHAHTTTTNECAIGSCVVWITD